MGNILNSKKLSTRCEKRILAGVCVFSLLILNIFYANIVHGLPRDYEVVSGTAEFQQAENTLTINASDKTIVNYGSFDIAAHEKVIVNLPSSTSEILNRVNSPYPTQIQGILQSNGILILVNESGIYVASSASITASGIILSTRDITNQNFLAGQHLFQRITQKELDLLLLNEGNITLQDGGFGVLIAGAVENKGVITARAGTIALAGGNGVRLEFDGKGLISVVLSEPVAKQVTDYEGRPVLDQVKNTGTLFAEGGTVILAASSINEIFRHSINLQGMVKGSRVENKNGVIKIVADGDVSIGGDVEAGEIIVEDVAPGEPIRAVSEAPATPDVNVFLNRTQEFAPAKITIEPAARIKAVDVIALVSREVIDIGVTIEAPIVVLITGGDIVTRDSAIIQAQNLTMTAHRFGALTTPVRVEAQNIHVKRLNGIIDIRESLGIGSTVVIRGPPDEGQFGSIEYNRSCQQLTLEGASVTISGEIPLNLYGNITFYNFICTVPGKTIYFESGKSYTFLGITEIHGAIGLANTIMLKSSIEGSAWYVYMDSSSYSLEWVGIQDSHNIGENTIYAKPKCDFGGNTGWAKNETYYISSWYDLNNMRYDLYGDYYLEADLSSSTSGYAGIGDNWAPVGATTGSPFAGTFNGQNHTISNLRVNGGEYSDCFGLFCVVSPIDDSVTISNVGLVNPIVTGGSYVGALIGKVEIAIGYSYQVNISNCYVNGGSVSGSSNVGGLIGGMEQGGSGAITISQCYSTASVVGTGENVGGLVGSACDYGRSEGGGGASIYFNDCYATGSVSSSSYAAGGLIGFALADGALSLAHVDVVNCFATGDVVGSSDAGGLIGLCMTTNAPNDYIYIHNSYATGMANGTTTGNLLIGRIEQHYKGSNGGPVYVSNSYYISDMLPGGNESWFFDPTSAVYTGEPDPWDFTDTWDSFSGVTYPHLAYENYAPPSVGITISGYAYQAIGGSAIANGTDIVSLVVMGTAAGTASTASDGFYIFSGISMPEGSEIAILVYLNSATAYRGSAITVTDSTTSNIENLNIYAGATVTVKHEASSGLTSIDNANLSDAKGSQSAAEILYSVAGGALILGNETYPIASLHIPSQAAFAPGGNVTLSGDWTNYGVFSSGGGTQTVILNGGNQSIKGSTTFNNLTKTVTASDTLRFEALSTQTITGTLTLQGVSGNLLSLRSTSDGSKWYINPQGTTTLSYLDVKDSVNTNATLIDVRTANCVNSGNNSRWLFVTPVSYTWIGDAASNLWSVASNWYGGVVPGSSNVAAYNPNVSNENCNIDISTSISGMNINANYTGTIYLGDDSTARTLTVGTGNYTQAGGTFDGKIGTLDINGSFTQSGGTFIAPVAGYTVEVNLTFSGGTYSPSNKVTFDCRSNAPIRSSTITANGVLGGTVIINKLYDSSSVIITAGTSINLGDNPLTNICGNPIINNGTITVNSGTWTIKNNYTNWDWNGAALTNNGTITHNGSGWILTAISGGCSVNFTNNTGATITYAGDTLSLNGNLTQNGTFDLSGKTITIEGIRGSTITAQGELGGTVIINKLYDSSSVIITAGTSINLGDNPLTNICGNPIINNGTITVNSGTWTIKNNYTNWDWNGAALTNNGTITHNGSGWILTAISGGCSVNFTNNTGATITYAGDTLSLNGNLTQNGTFDLSGKTVIFNGSTQNSILTYSGGTIGSIIINKSDYGTVAFTTDVTVNGDFIRTDGVVSNPSSAIVITINGNFSMSTTDAFGGANLTLVLGGSSDKTFTQNAGTISSPIQIYKSDGAKLILQTTMVTASTVDVAEGSLDLAGKTISAGGAFTIQDGARLRLLGSETVTTPNCQTNSTVEYYGTGDYTAYGLKAGSYYYNLEFTGSGGRWKMATTIDGDWTIAEGATVTMSDNVIVSGDIYLGGTLNDGGYTINLAGNWYQSGLGALNATGLVNFNGTDQAIYGSTTFHDIEKMTGGVTLTFEKGSTQVITGEMKLQGFAATPEGRLKLRSSEDDEDGAIDDRWYIDPQGSRAIQYLDVKDSECINATPIIASGTGSLNSGNNVDWIFGYTFYWNAQPGYTDLYWWNENNWVGGDPTHTRPDEFDNVIFDASYSNYNSTIDNTWLNTIGFGKIASLTIKANYTGLITQGSSIAVRGDMEITGDFIIEDHAASTTVYTFKQDQLGDLIVGGNILVGANSIISVTRSANQYNVAPYGAGRTIAVGGDVYISNSAAINASYKGFTGTYGPGKYDWGGATYGGQGGNNPLATYGSVTEPISLGSGGYG
ncbi:MAG: filamentous hemagglutinin N-terminal domain-containing protein, partial [Candidatus Omnitrophica bacterium]|nr:filamentous hemagglutinin N-terminal domain-containing protein [Candidatus Omnitrophota bacterium]